MSPPLLGTLIGLAIALLLIGVMALPQILRGHSMPAKYLDPEWQPFFKSAGLLIGFLVFLHWAPDLMVWFYEGFFGKALFINAQKYEFVLVVGYSLAMAGIFAGLFGNAWSAWHKLIPARDQ